MSKELARRIEKLEAKADPLGAVHVCPFRVIDGDAKDRARLADWERGLPNDGKARAVVRRIIVDPPPYKAMLR